MNEELELFIRGFVQRDKQERYRTLLCNPKQPERRRDGLWDLLHDGRHLERKNWMRIPHYQVASVATHLAALGAQGLGYVMAVQGELDDQRVALPVVLAQYLGRSQDVLAFFAQAKAGYYENHEGEVYVFAKTPVQWRV